MAMTIYFLIVTMIMIFSVLQPVQYIIGSLVLSFGVCNLICTFLLVIIFFVRAPLIYFLKFLKLHIFLSAQKEHMLKGAF